MPSATGSPFAAVDDADEVGVLQVLVGLRVAPIAMAAEDHAAERGGALVEIAGARRRLADLAGERRQMAVIAREVDLRPVARGKRQRRFRER